jgi:hypothetical protein
LLNQEENRKHLRNSGGNNGEKPVEKITDTKQAAEIMALTALTWVLGQDELVGAFLNATGAVPQDLGTLTQTPLFQAAILDFLMEDDARVIGFCDASTLPYTAVMHARTELPGGQLPNWT